MSNFFSSLEAINFQNKSKLASDLIDIFQECIDIRESFDGKDSQRIDAVVKHFKNVSVNRIKKALVVHTGLILSKVYVQNQFNLFFACLMKVGDKYGLTANDIIGRYSGMKSDDMLKAYMDYYKVKPATAKDMEKIADSLSLESGKLGETMFRNKNIEMELYFDPYSAFLTKETGHLKFEYFTAEEITGIVLHEIGHMMSMLEHSADAYYRIETYKAACATFEKTATTEEKKKFVKEQINKKMKTKLDKLPEDNVITIAVAAICSLIASAFLLVLSPMFLLFNILSRTIEEAELAQRDIGTKISDFASTRKNSKFCEQLADEYVARHGLGGAVISALAKLGQITSVSLPGFVRTSSAAYYIAKIPWMIQLLCMGDGSSGYGQYDNELKRAEQMLLNTLKIFKNEGIPDEMLQMYIKDYETTKGVVEKRNSSAKFTTAVETIHSALTYLLNPASLIQMVSSGRFNQEYSRLSDRVESLVANKLYFRAAKLDQILNQLKG